jgi:hypothetical protein
MAIYLTWRDAEGHPQREEADSLEAADTRARELREMYGAEDVEVHETETSP